MNGMEAGRRLIWKKAKGGCAPLNALALKLLAAAAMLIDHFEECARQPGRRRPCCCDVRGGAGETAFPLLCFLPVTGLERTADRPPAESRAGAAVPFVPAGAGANHTAFAAGDAVTPQLALPMWKNRAACRCGAPTGRPAEFGDVGACAGLWPAPVPGAALDAGRVCWIVGVAALFGHNGRARLDSACHCNRAAPLPAEEEQGRGRRCSAEASPFGAWLRGGVGRYCACRRACCRFAWKSSILVL